MNKLHAVLLAAGASRRYGSTSKLLEPLGSARVLEYSFAKIAALKPDTLCLVCSDPLPEDLDLEGDYYLVAGGAERSDSVINALRMLQPMITAGDKVLIHDAARPCVSSADLQALLYQCREHAVGGFLAAPITATLKRVGTAQGALGDVQTVPREGLYAAQTPQVFDFQLLLSALESCSVPVTDDAQAIELAGHDCVLVPGESSNIKITYPADLAMARAIIAAQSAP